MFTNARFTDNLQAPHIYTHIERSQLWTFDCLDEGNAYNLNGKIFNVNESISCDVKNVIYVIGQKDYKIHTTVHAQQIRRFGKTDTF